MGRLSGVTYRVLTKKLHRFGFVFWRGAKGSHEIWYCEQTGLFTTVPKHRGDLPEGTVHAILKQARIDVDEFLLL